MSAVILYDADCGVCRWLLATILTWDRSAKLRVLALQSDRAEMLLADVPRDAWMKSWHLVEPSGEVHSAGDAFPVLLDELPGGTVLKPIAQLGRLPLNAAYRAFAANRSLFGRFVPDAAKQRAQVKIDARALRAESELSRPGAEAVLDQQ